MSVQTWFRLIFVLIAIGMAIYLVANLVTGRTRVGRRWVDRRATPHLYWGSIGKTAIFMTALAITPFFPLQRDAVPLVFAGLFGGQLFEMLVSGTVQMPAAAYQRATQPRPYWGWVAFHAAVVLLFLFFLFAQRVGFIIL
jgi:hypothetical protein